MAFKIGDKYYHEDIESGEIVEISKAAFDAMNYMRRKVESMVDPDKKVKGTIIITSTMADDTNSNDYKNLWQDYRNEK